MTERKQLPDQVEDDVAGVQGSDPRDAADNTGTGTGADTDSPGDEATGVQAPDAGEIEWAGNLVKKAPRPAP